MGKAGPQVGQRAAEQRARRSAEEAGKQDGGGGWVDPESESHQADGFLWPEAVAEISLPSFLLSSPDLPPWVGKAREGLGGAVRIKSLFRKCPLLLVRGAWLASACGMLALMCSDHCIEEG